MNTSGILYIVATPIGNLADMSERAITILRQVDLIAAEDTRHSRHLLAQFAIATPMLSLHEHNEKQRVTHLLRLLQEGKSLALISDAGTPLISDPGHHLVKAARENGSKVVPVPGACALIAALCVSGLSSYHFTFEGFLSAHRAARLKHLQDLQYDSHTLIFYEAPHRIIALLEDMISVFGETRYTVVARELTKTFETVHGAPLAELLLWAQADANQQKGEFVVLVEGAPQQEKQEIIVTTENVLQILLSELPVKQAAQLAAKITGEKKNKIYQRALELKGHEQ